MTHDEKSIDLKMTKKIQEEEIRNVISCVACS